MNDFKMGRQIKDCCFLQDRWGFSAGAECLKSFPLSVYLWLILGLSVRVHPTPPLQAPAINLKCEAELNCCRTCEGITLLLPNAKHFLLCVTKPGNSFLCISSSLARMSSMPGKLLQLSLWWCLIIPAFCTFFHGIVALSCLCSACLCGFNWLSTLKLDSSKRVFACFS